MLESAVEKVDLPLDKSYKKSKANRRVGEFLVKDSDHLIGVWDGIYNGKPGGTSDVMDMAYTLQDQRGNPIKRVSPLTVHWLSAPRSQKSLPCIETPYLAGFRPKLDLPIRIGKTAGEGEKVQEDQRGFEKYPSLDQGDISEKNLDSRNLDPDLCLWQPWLSGRKKVGNRILPANGMAGTGQQL